MKGELHLLLYEEKAKITRMASLPPPAPKNLLDTMYYSFLFFFFFGGVGGGWFVFCFFFLLPVSFRALQIQFPALDPVQVHSWGQSLLSHH